MSDDGSDYDFSEEDEKSMNTTQQQGDDEKIIVKDSYVMVGNTKFEIDVERYKIIKCIGHGAFGVVVSAQDLITKEHVAIKKISAAFDDTTNAKRILREVKFLRCFNGHGNIMELKDIVLPKKDFNDIYIVSELLDTDLHQIISSKQLLTTEHLQYFIYQTLRGLKYVHSINVLHRDLKPSNILLNADCDLKICDFGLARIVEPTKHDKEFLTEYVATRWYRAPEIMLSWKKYTNSIDVWSVGCILGELLGRKALFPGRDYINQLHLIIETLGTPTYEETEYIISPKAKDYIRKLPYVAGTPFKKLFPNATEDAIDLLEKMLKFDPAKRITVDDALRHPYLANLHVPDEEPTCKVESIEEEFNFENFPLDKDSLKTLIYDEAMAIKEERFQQLIEQGYIHVDKNSVEYTGDNAMAEEKSEEEDYPEDIMPTQDSYEEQIDLDYDDYEDFDAFDDNGSGMVIEDD